MLFIGNQSDECHIWCLDLVTTKCRRSKVTIPGRKVGTTEIRFIASNDHYLHCVQYGHPSKEHYKKRLSEIIPPEFDATYRERETPLIVAYCRQSEGECGLSEYGLRSFPVNVIETILRLYQVFG